MSQQLDLQSVFETCQPREDVLEGSLAEDQFAANLSSVVFDPDDAAPVYRDATKFFNSTYPTEGLQTLLTTLASRFLSTAGYESDYDASILCLDTTFGGGKTHDLIASYHLADHPHDIDNLEQHVTDPDVATQYQSVVDDELHPRVAVFSGGYVDAENARCDTDDPDAPNTNTMWGEIAYQLYGADGYEQIKSYDQNRNPPGENTLRSLFGLSDDPVLILIDEIAQYLQAASGVVVTESETGEIDETTLSRQTLVFMKSLLETASNTENVNIVYSIADTAFADHAETVREEIRELDSIEQRQQQTITPTGDTEVSSVLRQRLFTDVDDEAATTIAEAYYEFYRDVNRQLPQDVLETEYRDDLQRDYPFHPSIINTLTEKIDSIPDFQKTRDALRLLARAIYYLWNNKPIEYDRHYLRLYDLTPADDAPSGSIRTKLNESLFEAVDLSAAVSADIYSDDETAHAQREDQRWLEKGFPALGSHITTTALWNSLAVGERALGLTRAELYEAIAHPGVNFDHYDSALDNLTGTDQQVGCYYLYDEDRIKFKAEPKLLYIIDQYTQNTPRAQARNRFEARIRREIGTGGFNTTPTSNPDSSFPEEPADLPDSATTPTLAILHFDSVTFTDDDEGPPTKVETLYEKTASSHNAPIQTRSYKNYILFLVPDGELIENGIEKARRLEGLERLRDDSDRTAELTDDQYEELGERLDRHKGLLGEQVRKVYRHLFYPERDGLEHVSITTVDTNGDNKMVEAVEDTLDDRILRDDSGARGEVWFKQRLWQQTKTRMTTQQLAEQFAKKPGLPYLFSTKPLRKTIARMVRESGYVYWNGETGDAYWAGGSEPENWNHDSSLVDSPDVHSTISSSDVKIGEEYALYSEIEALLDHEVVEPPEVEDEPPGDGPDEPGGDPVPDPDPPISDSTSWSHTSETASATRAFGEVREEAIAAGSGDATVGVEEARIEIAGDSVMDHGFFIAQRSLDEYTTETTVAMEYQAEGPDGTTRFSANFDGSLEDFRTLNQQLEGFADGDGRRKVDLAFGVSLSSPESLTDDEDDILATLRDELEGTDIMVQVQASGPTQMEVEA